MYVWCTCDVRVMYVWCTCDVRVMYDTVTHTYLLSPHSHTYSTSRTYPTSRIYRISSTSRTHSTSHVHHVLTLHHVFTLVWTAHTRQVCIFIKASGGDALHIGSTRSKVLKQIAHSLNHRCCFFQRAWVGYLDPIVVSKKVIELHMAIQALMIWYTQVGLYVTSLPLSKGIK